MWSAEAREKGGAGPDPVVNYNTYVLGREGYVSLNLITSSSTVEADKPAAHELLAAVDFNDGKRYGDFNSSTDKVAAYGLAALVGGLAAKKLGLLAAAGVFIAKFAKVIIIGVAAAGGAVVKFFKGRSDAARPDQDAAAAAEGGQARQGAAHRRDDAAVGHRVLVDLRLVVRRRLRRP